MTVNSFPMKFHTFTNRSKNICQTISGTAYYPAKGQLLANKPSIQNAPVIVPPNKKRRPSYGRRKRSTDAVDKRAEAIKSGIYDEIYGEENLPFNHEQMFHVLISIAEGYVKFNDFYHK